MLLQIWRGEFVCLLINKVFLLTTSLYSQGAVHSLLKSPFQILRFDHDELMIRQRVGCSR